MRPKLTLYSRKNCCLCDEMKNVLRQVGEKVSIDLTEVDVDSAPELQLKFSDEVPVLFIDGRKAFKYRVAAAELNSALRKRTGSLSKFEPNRESE